MLPLGLRGLTQIEHRHRYGECRYDDLHWAPINGDESSAQGLMALDDLVEALLERRAVEPAAHLHGSGDVVGRALRCQLMQKPEPLLSKRGWEDADVILPI